MESRYHDQLYLRTYLQLAEKIKPCYTTKIKHFARFMKRATKEMNAVVH